MFLFLSQTINVNKCGKHVTIPTRVEGQLPQLQLHITNYRTHHGLTITLARTLCIMPRLANCPPRVCHRHRVPPLLSGQNLGTHRLNLLSQVFHGKAWLRHQRDSRRQTRERWRMNVVSHVPVHPEILHIQVPHPPNARPIHHANSDRTVHCNHERQVLAKVTTVTAPRSPQRRT